MKEHKHRFESVKSIRQDMVKRYLQGGKYQINILNQEVITIFCAICGESKIVYESIAKIDDDEDKKDPT